MEIDTANFDQMQAKILEFNEQVGSHKVIFLSSYHFFFLSIYLIKIKKLNEQELAVLLEIIDTLKAVSRYHASKFYERHHNLVWKLLLWPEQQRFPSKILKEEKRKKKRKKERNLFFCFENDWPTVTVFKQVSKDSESCNVVIFCFLFFALLQKKRKEK